MSATARRGIAEALQVRGWEIEFLGPGAQHDAPRSSRLGRGHRSFNRSVTQRLLAMELDRFQLVIVEWTGVSGATEVLLQAGLPWVLMDRSPPVSKGIIGWMQNLQHREAWNMARVFASGRAVKSRHMAETQPWERRSAIVPAGVDIDAFEPAEMNADPVLVCHGSLDRTRELHRLVEMGFSPYLFGEGDDAERLAGLTRVEGPGPVGPRLAGCDIGLMHLPDREVWRNASPLKVAEFAAAGLPVVASAVSGLEPHRGAEWLRLTPLGDDAAFAAAVREFIGLDLAERRRLGGLARTHAEEHLTWERCTEDLHGMLVEVKR